MGCGEKGRMGSKRRESRWGQVGEWSTTESQRGCEAAGQPRPEVSWIKDGLEVRTAPADPSSHRVLLPSGALFFLKAVQSGQEDDRGTYWCVAANTDGQVVSRKARLDIASKIYFNIRLVTNFLSDWSPAQNTDLI